MTGHSQWSKSILVLYVTLTTVVHCYVVTDEDKISPKVNRVSSGETAEFTCHTTRSAFWHFNSDYMVFAVAKTIVISDVNSDNKGYYECTGFDERGEILLTQGLLAITGDYSHKKCLFSFIQLLSIKFK